MKWVLVSEPEDGLLYKLEEHDDKEVLLQYVEEYCETGNLTGDVYIKVMLDTWETRDGRKKLYIDSEKRLQNRVSKLGLDKAS